MAILTPLFPVFLCIMAGLAMARTGFPAGKDQSEVFWRSLERLNYFILLPVLLFENLATADLSGVDVMPLGLALVGAQIAMTVLMVLIKLAVKPDGPTYSSMFQGAVRWNGFIALGVTGALMGDNGIALTAIALAFMIPVANVLSVLVLSIYGENDRGEAVSVKLVLGLLARNPLIITCLLGITANLISLPIPGPLLATLEVMGNAALALGLFAVGAALNLSALRGRLSLIAITTVAKLALKPIVFIGLVTLFPMSHEMFVVGLVCAAVPGAPSSYILARQLGGNAELMAGLITASTLFGFLSLPLWLVIAS